tara:strand:- start:15948 stop:16562 length:615 start_codon:yes stop_codon:yes gene_type:complete
MKKLLKLIYLGFRQIFIPHIYRTANSAAPITLTNLFYQKILRINGSAYWPMHYTSKVSGVENIKIGIGTAPGLSPGCYIQGLGKIYIGDYTIVAPNVGIISANHEITDYRKHKEGVVRIGSYCWIGMNAVVMPNVILGDYTIVAAGAIVTKSFENGYCVVAGNPARVIKQLDKTACMHYQNEYKYYGYLPAEVFPKFQERNLSP